MVVHVNTVKLWLLEMKPTEVDEVVDSLHSLYLYHANENDTKEEEDEKPCATLHDCADILTWIMQFSN